MLGMWHMVHLSVLGVGCGERRGEEVGSGSAVETLYI